MFFQVKLLTSIKKYLINDINLWNRYHHYNNSLIYNRLRNSYSSFINTILFKKKETSTQNKRIRHTLLKDNFFLPLKENIITVSQIYSNNYPLIEFYKSENPESPLEKEGFEHLKQDINGFEQKFDELKKEVEEYNKKLYSFEQERCEKLISEFFKRCGFNVVNDIKELKENTVIITYELLEILKRFWYDNRNNFNHIFKDNRLLFNTYLTVALVSEKNIEKMNECIKNLKEYDIIKNEYKYFKDTYKKIIKDTDILSKDIQNNTIEKILKEEYNTKCDYCKILYRRF